MRYSTQTSPLLFNNVKISLLTFYGLTNSFIKKNNLDFIQTNNSCLNSYISALKVNFYNYILRNSFLDKNVYQNTRSINLKGSILRMENISFDSFGNLRELSIELHNFAYLSSKNPLWLNSFNSDLYLSNEDYSYPEQDFWIFKEFNLKRVCIVLNYFQSCSCTLHWLTRNSININENSNFGDCVKDYRQNCSFLHCNFSDKVRLCNKIKKIRLKSLIKKPRDILIDSQIVDFVGFILIPPLGMFAFISNLLCIKVLMSKSIRNENTNKTEKSMFNLMLLNSWLGLAFSLIYLAHLINKCVAIDGIFCSRINKEIFSQYYDIIAVRFIGSILKLLSSLISIQIAFNRLDLLENKQQGKKNKRKRYFKIIFYILLMFLILLINFYNILTSRINSEFIYAVDEYNYIEFPITDTFYNVILSESALPLNLKKKKKLYFSQYFK